MRWCRKWKIKANFLELGNLSISDQVITSDDISIAPQDFNIAYTGVGTQINNGITIAVINGPKIIIDNKILLDEGIFVYDQLYVNITSTKSIYHIATGKYTIDDNGNVKDENEKAVLTPNSFLEAYCTYDKVNDIGGNDEVSEYIPVIYTIDNTCYLDISSLKESIISNPEGQIKLILRACIKCRSYSEDIMVAIGDYAAVIQPNESYLGLNSSNSSTSGLGQAETIIGPNGIKIKTNKYNYLYMTNNLFIVSIGSNGLRIDNTGTYKRNSKNNNWEKL